MSILKNNRAGSLSIIIFSVALILFLVNAYVLMVNYNLANEKKLIIKNKIESSYSQSTSLYLNNFNAFCKIRDFINSDYKPTSVYVIYPMQSSPERLFNIDEVKESSKIPLNSKPLNSMESLALISTYSSQNTFLLTQIKNYLNSNLKECLVYYEYKDLDSKLTVANYLEMSK